MGKDALPTSPLAPQILDSLPSVAGVRLAAAQAGIKYQNRDDVLLIELHKGTSIAGVFTQSTTRAAPVDWCVDALQKSNGHARAIIINSGNANAFTGQAGVQTVMATAAAVATALGCKAEEVLISSTGVIGQPLDAATITNHVSDLVKNLAADDWGQAARAIMTTDTFPKLISRTCVIGNKTVTINGIAKGSGMIAPDMATMLGFIFTDAAIPPAILQTLVTQANAISFNAITVDGDTSTNDCVIVAATGAAGNELPIVAGEASLRDFRRVLTDVMLDLAQQVVRDGEGAQKFITVHITGAKHKADARRVAMAIGNSPLIKTAIAGEDANWGRIVMAVGKSGAQADRDKLKVSIGGILIAEAGQAVADFDEAPIAAHIKTQEVEINVDLGIGRGSFTAWTCDLTHGYISINADYRS